MPEDVHSAPLPNNLYERKIIHMQYFETGKATILKFHVGRLKNFWCKSNLKAQDRWHIKWNSSVSLSD